MKTLSFAAAALRLSASSVLAAPCATDKGKSSNQAMNGQSSDVDMSSKNAASGSQPASPCTVGARNNLGPNQGVTSQGAAIDKAQGREDSAAKNMAGND